MYENVKNGYREYDYKGNSSLNETFTFVGNCNCYD